MPSASKYSSVSLGSSDDPVDVRAELDRLQSELDALNANLGRREPRIQTDAIAADAVREVIEARRKRERLFALDLFSDPAWDILLELFLGHLEQQRVPTTRLGQAAAVPPTTALRWIEKLEASGWIIRNADPLDGRRVFIELSPRGSEMMERYFSE